MSDKQTHGRSIKRAPERRVAFYSEMSCVDRPCMDAVGALLLPLLSTPAAAASFEQYIYTGFVLGRL
jgi:hypothetical protein